MKKRRIHRLSDRGLVRLLTFLVVWLCFTSGIVLGDLPKTSPDVVIYSGTYPSFPWVTSTPDGKLLSVWREGTQHMYSSTGKIMISISENGGHAWSSADIVVDVPDIDDRNAAITAFSDTDWLVCYNSYTSSAESQAMTIRTTDGGLTWGAPQQISSLDARTRAAPIKLSSGRIIVPYYQPHGSVLAALSDDNGQTWQTTVIANTENFVGDEWSVMEMPDQSLVGIVRDSGNADGYFWLTKSTTQGLSWSTPVRTNLRDERLVSPAQIFLHEGNPWVVYDDLRRISVAMATTNDPNLIDWNVDDRLQIYQYNEDRDPVTDGGYPSSASVGGNERFVVDYLIDGDIHQIVGYFVTLPGGIPGDANHDGYVNGSDVTILANHWQATGADWSMGDFNDDGIVDGSDVTILANHWQEGISSESASAVPEPSTMIGLLTLFLAGLALIRRR